MTDRKRLLFVFVAPPSLCTMTAPPMGLLYMAAYLRERFPLDIRVIHQRVEEWSIDRLAKEIVAFDPHILGLGCMTPSAYALPEVTAAVKAALPDTLMVLGGPHPTAFGAEALEATSAHIAVVGEGELAMEQIVRNYLEGESMEGIAGLIWRNKEGEIITNPGAQPLIQDLDSLPMPAYDLIDVRKYWQRNGMPVIPFRKYVSLFSSRGCPYGCIYCHNVFGKRFRAHSAERMVEEVKRAVRDFGADEIEFLDDCFNLDRKRLTAYSDLLQKEVGPVKTAFPNAIRADLLDEETVDALVSAGMYYTALALESGTPRIQELIGKRLNIPKFVRATELCDRAGVFTNGFVMLGFPTETAEEMRETIRIASESRLHVASFFRTTPFPNTPMYEYVKKHTPEKLRVLPFNEMEYWRVKVNVSSVRDEELDYYLGFANRRFYLRPGRLYRILRDYPKPMALPGYFSLFLTRILAGLH